jgi:NAD(P)-dependent dehydrogenase (short-subunit alcohol dehydrogenase family)
VAIVTGGARGLGRAIAERLADEGASVSVVALHAETAAEAAAAIEQRGGRVLAIAADVSSEADTRRYVAGTVEAFGRLDVLVNNAGVISVGPLVETAPESWDRMFEVNVRGTFLGCREAARRLIEQGEGGRIVNCSSGAGRRGLRSSPPMPRASSPSSGSLRASRSSSPRTGSPSTPTAPGT